MGRMSMSAMQGRTTSAPTSALSARLKVDKNKDWFGLVYSEKAQAIHEHDNFYRVPLD